MLDFKGMTFGAEVEAADWNPDEGLAPGQDLDRRDVTMVNSDGVAVDPKRQIYALGGELLLAPTERPEGLAEQLQDHMARHPRTTVNYRSNLHVHVRVPGLREDLDALKRLQAYVHEWMPKILPVLEPIPECQYTAPRGDDGSGRTWDAATRGALKRAARRRVSHHKLLSTRVVERQLRTTTPDQFLDAEALHEPTGRLLWATCPRACVNLRQLRETDTVEFRHFPGTTDPEQLLFAAGWVQFFIRAALEGTTQEIMDVVRVTAPLLPKFLPYDHDLERGYLLTSRKYVTPEEARRNIPEVLSWGLAERGR